MKAFGGEMRVIEFSPSIAIVFQQVPEFGGISDIASEPTTCSFIASFSFHHINPNRAFNSKSMGWGIMEIAHPCRR